MKISYYSISVLKLYIYIIVDKKGTFALIDTSPHFGANSLVKLGSLEVWTAQKTSALVTLALLQDLQ